MMSRSLQWGSAERGSIGWWKGAAVPVLAALVVSCAARGPEGAGPAQPPIRTARSAAWAEAAIDSARVALVEAARAGAGVGVAVVEDGELVWAEGVGFADLETARPVDPEATLFRIYSVSKPLTATALARLMERGRLDPEAPIRTYVESFPAKHPPLTAMQLATHTAGIRHYRDAAEAAGDRRCRTVEEALAIFEDDPLVHAPGTAELYSSWGYVLLSAAVESVAEAPFPTAMERLVLEPAGMDATVLEDPAAPRATAATAYTQSADGIDPAPAVDISCKWGAGAYLSTPVDVARFGAALLDGSLISPRTLQLFLRGQDTYLAQGVGTGATAFLVVDAASDLSVALLANASGPEAGPAAKQALERIHALFARSGQ